MCFVNQVHRAARCPTCLLFGPSLEFLQVYLSLYWLYVNVKYTVKHPLQVFVFVHACVCVAGLIFLLANAYMFSVQPSVRSCPDEKGVKNQWKTTWSWDLEWMTMRTSAVATGFSQIYLLFRPCWQNCKIKWLFSLFGQSSTRIQHFPPQEKLSFWTIGSSCIVGR